MKSTIVEFKVAMDSEQAKLKNHKKVTLKVEYPENVMDLVFKAATKSYVIDMQSQIRNHWDKFMQCDLPEVVEFGQVLYGKKQRTTVRKPTEAEMAEAASSKLARMSPEQIQEFIQTGKFPEGI